MDNEEITKKQKEIYVLDIDRHSRSMFEKISAMEPGKYNMHEKKPRHFLWWRWDKFVRVGNYLMVAGYDDREGCKRSRFGLTDIGILYELIVDKDGLQLGAHASSMTGWRTCYEKGHGVSVYSSSLQTMLREAKRMAWIFENCILTRTGPDPWSKDEEE